MTPEFALHLGDCLDTLKTLADNSVDSIVTDPPYGLSKEPDMAEVLRHWLAGDDYQHKGGGFMGKTWDSFVPGPSVWRECLRVLKPGGHLLAFFGTRTQDIGTLAIRLAGFEIRDSIAWVYGSGFPKSMDVSKAIDKAAGAAREVVGVSPNWRESKRDREKDGSMEVRGENAGLLMGPPVTDAARQWSGWGTALKPGMEPITVARKPLIGTVAANMLAHGTGALNIDACRVHSHDSEGYAYTAQRMALGADQNRTGKTHQEGVAFVGHTKDGRWPANLIHDGSDEVLATFPQDVTKSTGGKNSKGGMGKRVLGTYALDKTAQNTGGLGDEGTPARFFYAAKASRKDRGEGNAHPTVKPTDLMAYLCRLVTPPGGVVLDPFMGSGSTGKAAMREGFRFIGCELSTDYMKIALARIKPKSEERMTIYATPFDDETKQAVAPSSDSGFDTIADVVDAMGDEWKTCSSRAVIYEGLMFSDYPVAL